MKAYLPGVIALLALAACQDQVTAPATPGSFITASETRVLNPHTGRLELVQPAQMHGISASIAGSQTLPGIVVPNGSPSLSSGAAMAVYDYTDSATGKPGRVTEFWPASGGPGTAMYHVMNGKLLATTVFHWSRTSTGWYANKAVSTIYMSNGATAGTETVVAQTTTVAQPCNPKTQSCPPQQTVMHRAMCGALYALAMATSSPALGQVASCWREWARYLASASVLMSAMGAAEADWFLIGGAVGLYSDALWELDVCLERGMTNPSPLFPGGGSGGTKPNADGPDCSTGGLQCPQAYAE